MILAVAIAMLQPKVDQDRLLDCIAVVEGTKPSAPGGEYGLSRLVWQQYSHLPYRFSAHPAEARLVAKKHLRWLMRSLREEGHPVTVYHLAVCWRHGLERGIFLFNDPTPGYGRRVEALYGDH